MASKTQQLILAGETGCAAEVGRLREHLRRRQLYVEIQDNGVVDEASGMSQANINASCARSPTISSCRAVITSDVHYLLQEHAKPHDALLVHPDQGAPVG